MLLWGAEIITMWESHNKHLPSCGDALAFQSHLYIVGSPLPMKFPFVFCIPGYLLYYVTIKIIMFISNHSPDLPSRFISLIIDAPISANFQGLVSLRSICRVAIKLWPGPLCSALPDGWSHVHSAWLMACISSGYNTQVKWLIVATCGRNVIAR